MNIKRINWFVLLCLFTFSYSCKEEQKQQNSDNSRKQNYIEGHVKDEKGEPVAGLLVGALIGDKLRGGSLTDDEGFYRVNLPLNEERIQIRYALHPQAPTDFKTLKDTTITKIDWDKHEGKVLLSMIQIQLQNFTKEGILVRGKLLDVANGNPLPKVPLTWRKNQKIVTNKLGNYLLLVRDSISENVSLHFTSPDKSWKYDTTIVAKKGDIVYLPDLKMTKEQTHPKIVTSMTRIQGKVTDINGKPLQSVSVSSLSIQSGTYSKRDGTFTFLRGVETDGLSDTLVFQKEGYHERRKPVKLFSGKHVDLDTIILKEKKK